MPSILTNVVERAVGLFERKDEREFLPAALEVVETPASPTSRILGALIITFFVCAVTWAFIGRVDITATAQGRILPAGDVKVIQPLDPGMVRAIYVQDGQHVRKGQVLIELDPTQPAADRDRLYQDLVQAKLDVARLRALQGGFSGGRLGFQAPSDASAEGRAEAQAAMRAQAAQEAAKVADLTQQIAQKDAELAEVSAQIDKTKASLPMLEEKDRINRELTARGFGSSLSALDAAQALSDARHDLNIASQKSQEARAAKAALERQREGVHSQFQSDVLSDLRKAEEQQNELSQNLIKAQDKSADTELRAPNDGVVEQLAVHTLHGVVLPGQHLMTIVPDTSNLIIEAKLENKDVGFVYPGQSVKVKIETFNFTRYGIVEGKVIDVSRDTVDQDPRTGSQNNTPAPADSASSPVPKTTSPTYVARVALLGTSMMVDGARRSLQPGMSVTAEIRTGSRSIADYLLSPIARKTQESLHER
jgi:hemolysin D